jgi:LL-H family phage holin
MMAEKLVFNILMAIVVALAGIIAKELLPYLKRKQEELTARLRKTQWAFAADIVDAVVRAVEQTVSEELHGAGKKDLAVRYIRELLKQNGIYVTAEQLDALIEAAVQAMNAGTIKVETLEAREGEIEKAE